MVVRIHWYWPFARQEELAWAFGTARDRDSILVQVIDRSEAPSGRRDGPVTVVRDLPDVDRQALGRIRWAVSRADTYRRRASARRAHWRNGQFDLVHLHYLNRFTDAIVPLPHPVVMSVHDVMPHVPRFGAQAERHLLARLYRRADGLVVHHADLADSLMQDFDILGSRIHVVPHQVFPVGNVTEPDTAGPPVVLFFGALRPNKGLDVLAEAMAALAGAEIRLVIAGRGDAGLEQRALDLAARDSRVSVELGFATLKRKRQLFCDASVVVMPYTTFASQSGVLHDAYGHGRPVVVTDVGALGSTVREDQTGIVVPPNDALGLANGLRRSLDRTRWHEYASAGRRIAQVRSPAVVGRHLRDVYDQVAH